MPIMQYIRDRRVEEKEILLDRDDSEDKVSALGRVCGNRKLVVVGLQVVAGVTQDIFELRVPRQ
jgi:hypothetical protein